MTLPPPIVAVDARDGLARLTIDHPPVNALSTPVRRALLAALRDAEADPAIGMILLMGRGRTFSAGADLAEFDRPREEPGWPALIDAITDNAKPIVAALHGPVLGGGLELALACTGRIAHEDASFGFPEVELGLIPASGGTQRLPRLVGPALALEMIGRGRRLDAREALSAGLIDAIVAASDWPPATVAPLPVRATREPGAEAVAAFRHAHARRLAASAAMRGAVDAIAAADLPLAQGLSRERDIYAGLKDSDEAGALLYLKRAERAASRVPPGQVREISRVAVIGAGTMGAGIATCFLDADIRVTLVETDGDALARGMARIDRVHARQVEAGRRSATDAAARLALLTPTLALPAIAGSDLVIEAVFEDLAVKTALFAQIDRVARADAILASNTSFLDLDAIAAATARPERVIGLHFFSPANVMRLLEVVRRRDTPVDTIATVMALARRIGKVPVLVGACFGFVGNRMVAHRQAEANRLLLEGAMPWDVDRVLRGFGFAMGPFEMSDLVGLDLGWRRETSTGSTLRERLCEAGRFGQKNGAGFYDYGDDRTPRPSAVVHELVTAFALERGRYGGSVADKDILDRCLLPIINEGAKLLDEGIAARASDIDVVWSTGYGWPRWRGGPMRHADGLGLPTVLNRLRALAATHGEPFTPSPHLERLVREGRSFADSPPAPNNMSPSH